MAGSRTARHIHPVVSIGLRLALCAVFAYAGALKLWHTEAFFIDVQSYRLFPDALARLIVYFIPALELVCALGLWVPRYRVSAAGLLMLLLGAFTVLLAVSWARGLDISCGCFGKTHIGAQYPWLIVRDLALLALTSIVFFIERHQNRPHAESC